MTNNTPKPDVYAPGRLIGCDDDRVYPGPKGGTAMTTLVEAVERIKRDLDYSEQSWSPGGMVLCLNDDLRTLLAALPTDDDVERVIEICAQIADMHDHKGDIGNAIRRTPRAAIHTLIGRAG